MADIAHSNTVSCDPVIYPSGPGGLVFVEFTQGVGRIGMFDVRSYDAEPYKRSKKMNKSHASFAFTIPRVAWLSGVNGQAVICEVGTPPRSVDA